jgi:hypothetical protein
LKAKCFDSRFGVALQSLSTLRGATRPAGIALVEAKKDMMTIKHKQDLIWDERRMRCSGQHGEYQLPIIGVAELANLFAGG